ncbi:MAG: hypothetical protein EPN85_15015 [Bacteroidetes bacterium]|nr:MAG: hypothetical protein EPN85_15015 [Bacteroidota bacterium]
MTKDRTPADNKGFAIAGVPCFADTLVQGGSSVLRMKFSANNPRHRKPPKRYLGNTLIAILIASSKPFE